MGEKPKDIKTILAEAMEKPTAEERSAYLDGVCGGDSRLRQEVESLLQLENKVGDFLEVRPFDPNVILDDSPLVESPGTVIGKYKLLEKIGEGGMAVVYMAEQEKPLRRRVALKIIKLGMDTKSVIARFEVERQALAMMDHPNIAKVFDAGTTETGRPYFVMELVRGVSISRYCDKNKLDTKQRLDLFLQVCNAVQHAHQKGIIHRDLKPTNVMVTQRDGKAVPKVIDFGIAKATNQKLTEKTLFTRYAHIIGTPAYMSPEQAELSELDVDTRTDIYSLGVLLYELLTGATPFSEEQLREAGYIEMQRIIREEEPARPSTKLSTMAETLTDIAEQRKTKPDLLTKLIRGDLDWIVMKSLEKDRSCRYDTVVELAADVERHLSNEPVQAAAPSPLYKAHKFIRRHRIGVMAGLLVAAALLIGVIGTTIGLIEANSQRKLAKAQHQRAEENLHHVLETLDSTLLKKDLGSELGLRKVFGKLDELSAKFPKLPDYRRDLITCYVGLASSLKPDQSEEFEESYQKVLSVVESMETETNHVPEYREPLALLHSDFGLVMSTSRHPKKAQYHYKQAIGFFEKLAADSPSFHSYHAGLAECLSFAAQTTEGPNSSELHKRAFEHAAIAVRQNPAQLSYRRMLVRQCDHLQSRPRYEQAITLLEDNVADDPNCRYELSRLLSNLSDLLGSIGDAEGSQSARRRAITYWRQTIEPSWEFLLTFGNPTNLGPPVNSSANDFCPRISADGLELFFASTRSSGSGGTDLWVTTRPTTEDDWSDPVNLGPTVNSSSTDNGPCLSADGLSLFFYSSRPGGYGRADLYVTTREAVGGAWGTPMNLEPPVNSSYFDGFPSISADGLQLYFSEWLSPYRPGGHGDNDMWVTTRETLGGVWSTPANLGPTVNSSSHDDSPFITADGLTLFFSSMRPGGSGSTDIWVTTRPTTEDDWVTPVNLGPVVNSSYHEEFPSISADGSTLFFSSGCPDGLGGGDIWQVEVDIVDNLTDKQDLKEP